MVHCELVVVFFVLQESFHVAGFSVSGHVLETPEVSC